MGSAFFIFIEIYLMRKERHNLLVRATEQQNNAAYDINNIASVSSMPASTNGPTLAPPFLEIGQDNSAYTVQDDQNIDQLGESSSSMRNPELSLPTEGAGRLRSYSSISEQTPPSPVDVYIIREQDEALPHQTSLYLRIAAICK